MTRLQTRLTDHICPALILPGSPRWIVDQTAEDATWTFTLSMHTQPLASYA